MSFTDLLTEAIRHHQAGRLREAEAVYRRVLAAEPDHPDALHLLGLVCHQTGRHDEAQSLLNRAIARNPTFAEAYSNLGVMHRQQGRLEEAEACYKRAVDLKPDLFDAWLYLGQLLRRGGRYAEAEPCFREVVRLRPDSTIAHCQLGLVLVDQGRTAEAIEHFRASWKKRPQDPESLTKLALGWHKVKQLSEAESCFRDALRIRPDYAPAHSHYSNLLMDLGHLQHALEHALEAVRLRPDHAGMRVALGNVYHRLWKLAEAADCFREALRLQPGLTEVQCNLGNVLLDLGHCDDALACYGWLLDRNPDDAQALVGKARSIHRVGRIDEAQALLERAVDLNPKANVCGNLAIALTDQGRLDQADDVFDQIVNDDDQNASARMSRAMLWLMQGRFTEGWAEYEWRWRQKENRRPTFAQPEWDGSRLDGKTILLLPEQGQGDAIQFIRYARLVKERGGRVILRCAPGLVDLFATCPGLDHVYGSNLPLPAFDTYAFLLSLPRITGTTLETIPGDIPYLFADPSRMERWQRRVSPLPGRKVGIVWQGNPDHRGDWKRSVSASRFACLAAIPGITVVKLQKGSASRDPAAAVFHDLGEGYEVGDWLDTAAILAQLDLVVGVDTSVSHLAGALGVPIWLAVSFTPDFRWLLNRDDSPWYPTVRLFRQERPGDWDGLFASIESELRRLAADQSAWPSRRTAPGHEAQRAQTGPDDDMRKLDLGVDCARNGSLAGAVAIFREIIDRSPQFAAAHFNLAQALAEQNKLDDAIATYRAAMRLEPSNPDPRVNLGVLLARLGRYVEAEASYREALALRPTHFAAMINLGGLLGNTDRPEEGWELLLTAEQLGCAIPQLHHAMAAIRTKLNRSADAESHRRRTSQPNTGSIRQ